MNICRDDPAIIPKCCLNVSEFAFKMSVSFIRPMILYIFINYEQHNLHIIFNDCSVIASLILLQVIICLAICYVAYKSFQDDTQPSSSNTFSMMSQSAQNLA